METASSAAEPRWETASHPPPPLLPLLLSPEASCPFKVRGHVSPQIFEPSGFWKQLPKDKKLPNNICYMWYHHVVSFMIRTFSASYHQLLNSNLRSLDGAEPETGAFIQLCALFITNHTWVCWAYKCNDQSEAFRWVRWVHGALVLTEFPGEFSHQKQQSAEVHTM